MRPPGDAGSPDAAARSSGAHRSTTREVEWKLTSSDPIGITAVRPLLPDVTIGDGTSYRLTATYYDTDDLRLARRGITLRRRTGGHDDGWHLKLPNRPSSVSALDRDEIAIPLGEATDPPRELTSLVTAFARGHELRAIGVLRTHRGIHPLSTTDDGVIGELCRDEVRADITRSGSTPAPTVVFHEWEIEARADKIESVSAVVDTLLASGFSASTSTSKLRHALGAEALAPHPLAHDEHPSRRRSARDDIVYFLKEQTETLLVEDHRVRLRLPDAVHRSRVAVRRLRSALRTFAPVLDSEALSDLRADLVWAGEILSHERDLEVIQGRLVSTIDALPTAGTSEVDTARDILVSDLGRLREDAHRVILESLDSSRWVHMLDRLVEVAHDPPTTSKALRPAARVLPPLAAKQWKVLADRAKHLTADAPAKSWHNTRISAKRARYAAEACAPAMGREPARLAHALAALTDLLGDLQDTDVSRAYLRDLTARGVANAEAVAVLDEVYAAEERDAVRLQSAFPDVWSAAARPRLRRWLRG